VISRRIVKYRLGSKDIVNKERERRPHGLKDSLRTYDAKAVLEEIVPGIDAGGLVLRDNGMLAGHQATEGYFILSAPDLHSDSSISFVMRFMDCGNVLSRANWEEGGDTVGGWLGTLKGQVMVDIGAGASCDGYRFARMLDAKAYIGIEAHCADILVSNINRHVESEKGNQMPFVIISEDMCQALGRFPSGSVSVLASAIDSFLYRNGKYLEKVAEEVSRVTGNGGKFIAYLSDIVPPGMQESTSRIMHSLKKYQKI
jgi:hypothetical protein